MDPALWKFWTTDLNETDADTKENKISSINWATYKNHNLNGLPQEIQAASSGLAGSLTDLNPDSGELNDPVLKTIKTSKTIFNKFVPTGKVMMTQDWSATTVTPTPLNYFQKVGKQGWSPDVDLYDMSDFGKNSYRHAKIAATTEWSNNLENSLEMSGDYFWLQDNIQSDETSSYIPELVTENHINQLGPTATFSEKNESFGHAMSLWETLIDTNYLQLLVMAVSCAGGCRGTSSGVIRYPPAILKVKRDAT
jgi:hypothetical protein